MLMNKLTILNIDLGVRSLELQFQNCVVLNHIFLNFVLQSFTVARVECNDIRAILSQRWEGSYFIASPYGQKQPGDIM